MLNRKLLVKWRLCDECPEDYSELFEESPYFSTFSGETPELADHRVIDEWDFRINLVPDEFRDVVHGVPRFFQNVPELNAPGSLFPKDELWWRWSVVLRTLKPVPGIQKIIDELTAELDPERTLGVHLRRTDVMECSSKPITTANVNLFDEALWVRILEEVDSGKYSHIYLAADDKRYFFEWRDRLSELPVKVVCFEQSWGSGFRQTPMEGVVVDLFMMIRCRLVLASIFSSLLFIADRMGGVHQIVNPYTLGVTTPPPVPEDALDRV